MAFAPRPSTVHGVDAGPRALHVACLAARGSELWACADEPSGFEVGVSTDDGFTFDPRLHLGSVGAAVACAPDSSHSFACGADANASQCSGVPLEKLCANLGCSDAGVLQSLVGALPAWRVTGGCALAAGSGAGLVVAGITAAAALARRTARPRLRRGVVKNTTARPRLRRDEGTRRR